MNLYFENKQELAKVASIRQLKASTIVTHLCEAIKQGVHFDLGRLGLTDARRHLIERVIATDEDIASNVMRLAPIKTKCDEAIDAEEQGEVTFDELKVVVALLIAQYGLKDNIVQWPPEKIQELKGGGTSGQADGKDSGHVLHSSKGQREDGGADLDVWEEFGDTQELEASMNEIESDHTVVSEFRSTTEKAASIRKSQTVANAGTSAKDDDSEGCLRRTQSAASTSDAEKRSQPGWMAKGESSKEAIRKKMKKNSLFK